MVWLVAGALPTVWNAPDAMIGGDMVMVMLPLPSAVTGARTKNCCRCGSVTLVTGLTAYTVAMVNTSPSFKAFAAVQPLVMSEPMPEFLLAAQVVELVTAEPLVTGVPLLEVSPVVCVAIFCEEYVSTLPIMPSWPRR